jgi:hypothetical protein
MRYVADETPADPGNGGSLVAGDVSTPSRGAAVPPASWTVAAVRAAIALVLSVVVFIVVPDRAIAKLSPHLSPRLLDTIVVAWITVVFLVMCWAFVRLQRGRGR